MAELVDARDLKSLGYYYPCRFDSGPRYIFIMGRLAQLARALARHARGHWFKSSIAHSIGAGVKTKTLSITVEDSSINTSLFLKISGGAY